uniref:Uncharacterized protein n=1 Tax=Knipowitschia caucasica TaxID=637954 RepID=A0AAV2KNX6_KNICA
MLREPQGLRPHFSASTSMSIDRMPSLWGTSLCPFAELSPADIGLYSMLPHHHYCGSQERRIFRLTVGPPTAAKGPRPQRPPSRGNDLS